METKKPLEWIQHFCGSQDNEFVMTLSVHKRGPHAVVLGNKVEKADVIIASPEGAFGLNNAMLSSLHTVFIDSVDYIIDQEFLVLKKVL